MDQVLLSIEGEALTAQDVFEKRPDVEKEVKAGASFQSLLQTNESFRSTLQALSLQRALEADAKSRGVNVRSREVDAYVLEVARQNGLDEDGFKAALEKEGISLSAYKDQIRFDILRAKLVGKLNREAVAVSEIEVKDFLEERPELLEGKQRVFLKRILISREGKNETELERRRAQVVSAIRAEQENFSEIARSFSDGDEASRGGIFGILSLEDANETLRSSLGSLEEGSVSDPIEMSSGINVFKVERKIPDEDEPEAEALLFESVRDFLAAEKRSLRIDEYFAKQLGEERRIEQLF